MHYFEVMNTRKVTPYTIRHYYPYLPIIQNEKRAAFWKLQGDIMGSVSHV